MYYKYLMDNWSKTAALSYVIFKSKQTNSSQGVICNSKERVAEQNTHIMVYNILFLR